MRKFIIMLLILLLPVIGGCLYFATNKIKTEIHKQITQIIEEIGFEYVTLPPIQLRINQALYSDIQLDREGFSTIKFLLIDFNPIDLVLNHRISGIQLLNTALTGELSKDQKLTIAGHNNIMPKLKSLMRHPPLIEIKNLDIDLLTEEFGGVSISTSLQARPKDKDLDIQGHIETKQKDVAFNGNLSGFFSSPDLWTIDIEIDTGRINLPTLKASRVSGTTKITHAPNAGLSLISKLDAGGLSIYDTPWQKGSATVEYENKDLTLFLGAKSLGVEELDLSVQYEPGNQTQWLGTINAPNLNTFFTYMDKQGLTLERNETLTALNDIDNIDIEFVIEHDTPNDVHYIIKNYEKDINVEGILELGDDTP